MVLDQIHKNDIGTKFKLTIKDEDDSIVDVSSATTIQILFSKPSGTILTKTASLTTDGTDGVVEYDSISGDLDETGLYKIQGKVILDGNTWSTEINYFVVESILE